jgi:hypothetical protein
MRAVFGCQLDILHRKAETGDAVRRGRCIGAAALFLEICSLFGQVTRQDAIYEHKSDRPLDKEKGISPVAVFRVLLPWSLPFAPCNGRWFGL